MKVIPIASIIASLMVPAFPISSAASNLQSPDTSGGLRRMSIDDVLGMEHLDQVATSPDDESIAVVVQRGANKGEVYGRTAYETDPSRNDVWLISRSTRQRRNITNGGSLAAGFWCVSWSPDGRRVAMLSTRPEETEPHGGDNVRLYVWDRETDTVSTMGDVAMMTQTRYGGAIHRLDLRGGADRGNATHTCGGEEDSPFIWLDDHRLLAVTLPAGHVSSLIDEASRPFQVEARDSQRLRDGTVATAEAFGSGAERMPPSPEENADIQIIDVATKAWTKLATVPDYPFLGDLTVSVSPDGKRAAVLAPVSAFQPVEGQRFPQRQQTDWLVEKRAGIIDLRVPSTVRWLPMPSLSPNPLELLALSPDSRRVALRSRRDAFDPKPALLVADARSGRTSIVVNTVMDQPAAGTIVPHDQQFLWIDAQTALARLREPNGSRLDWWRIGLDGSKRNLTADRKEAPSTLRKLPDGRFVTIEGKSLVSLDPGSGGSTTLADIGAADGSFLWSNSPSSLVLTSGLDERQTLRAIDADGHMGPPVTLPSTAIAISAASGFLLWKDGDESGIHLQATDLRTARTTPLMSLDDGLASIAWGRTMFFDYATTDGKAVKGAALLPPDYQSGRRYPTLVWVYDGYSVDPNGDYFLDPQMPGFYNLQLYAAKGYVVLVPSMPLASVADRKNVYDAITSGVLPAIDKLSVMGIADPARVGVFGQSYGGYSVYALLSQSDRFKAGVAMAGITDLQGYYEQPDPLGRGYPGIGHEKSANWIIADQFGLHGLPTLDHDQYWLNSPLAHVGNVHTPLLMLHGTFDTRGSITQADQFFYALYAQGKTARLVRYGGESHSLAQSPANIRDVFRETIDWFDRYVKNPASH